MTVTLEVWRLRRGTERWGRRDHSSGSVLIDRPGVGFTKDNSGGSCPQKPDQMLREVCMFSVALHDG